MSSEWAGTSTGVIDVTGPIEVVLWLAVLEDPGPLGACIACRRMSVWRHPEHGYVHIACIPRVMESLSADEGAEAPVARSATRRRGAYSRRGAV